MERDLVLYQPIITDIKEIISAGQQSAYSAANTAMVLTYWHTGKRIVEQEQKGSERAEIERQKEIFYTQHPVLREKGGDEE